MATGHLCRDLGLPDIEREHDRFMLCGSPPILADIWAVLEKPGLGEGNMCRPSRYVIERAFVDE